MIARQHSVERRYREVSVFAKGFQWIVVAALIVAAGIFGLAAGPAAAQTATQTAGPFGGFKHDSTAPIEIVADALEVQQTNNLAIFTGDVVAAQATLRLTTDKLTVTYAAEKSDADTGAIQHMRADGNVFLSNGSETAQGAWAEYDVANGMMRMGGSVVLTQGENATAGDSLVINLNTGVGKIEGGRVKSVFTPAAKTPETEETTPETPHDPAIEPLNPGLPGVAVNPSGNDAEAHHQDSASSVAERTTNSVSIGREGSGYEETYVSVSREVEDSRQERELPRSANRSRARRDAAQREDEPSPNRSGMEGRVAKGDRGAAGSTWARGGNCQCRARLADR